MTVKQCAMYVDHCRCIYGVKQYNNMQWVSVIAIYWKAWCVFTFLGMSRCWDINHQWPTRIHGANPLVQHCCTYSKYECWWQDLVGCPYQDGPWICLRGSLAYDWHIHWSIYLKRSKDSSTPYCGTNASVRIILTSRLNWSSPMYFYWRTFCLNYGNTSSSY